MLDATRKHYDFTLTNHSPIHVSYEFKHKHETWVVDISVVENNDWLLGFRRMHPRSPDLKFTEIMSIYKTVIKCVHDFLLSGTADSLIIYAPKRHPKYQRIYDRFTPTEFPQFGLEITDTEYGRKYQLRPSKKESS